MAKAAPKKNDSSANIGFEAKLWLAADKLRNNMDAAEYKHVVLGLIFLKYISDAFEEMRAKLVEGKGDYAGADPEDADEYRAENVFWVPKEARWSHLMASAKQATIGKVVDDAMVALERDNPRLKGVLPKDYARPALDKHRLGELIDRVHRELTDEDIASIASTYHAWRGDPAVRPELVEGQATYADTPGFCKSATTAEIATHGYVLTPGRYVGAEEVEEDSEPFEEKMARLVVELNGQFAESAKLEQAIKVNMGKLGYGL